jgi:hypothetical protein
LTGAERYIRSSARQWASAGTAAEDIS